MMESKEEHNHDEYKVKQRFDYLTSDVLKEKKKHTLAKMRFYAYGNVIFFLSACITLVQAIMATLIQGKKFDEMTDENMTIAIAVLAAFSVFWQSLIKHWNFDGRSSMHDSAGVALGKIYVVALSKRREGYVSIQAAKGNSTSNDASSGGGITLGGETNTATEGGDAGEEIAEAASSKNAATTPGEDDAGNNFHTLSKQFEQAIESCTSQVPPQIASAFELLDNRVEACKRKVHTHAKSSDGVTKVQWENVYPCLYRQLTAIIISQRGWPYIYPDPEAMVELTMQKYIKDMEAGLLKKLLGRDQEINNLYEQLESGDDIA